MADPRLLALATAVPPYRLGQPEVAERTRRLFADKADADIERLLPVFAHAGIDCRYSCVPIDWYSDSHGWVDRTRLYVENAVTLLEQAARRALAQAELDASDIDAVVTVSTTGIRARP